MRWEDQVRVDGGGRCGGWWMLRLGCGRVWGESEKVQVDRGKSAESAETGQRVKDWRRASGSDGAGEGKDKAKTQSLWIGWLSRQQFALFFENESSGWVWGSLRGSRGARGASWMVVVVMGMWSRPQRLGGENRIYL